MAAQDVATQQRSGGEEKMVSSQVSMALRLVTPTAQDQWRNCRPCAWHCQAQDVVNLNAISSDVYAT
jgi:hypothetical protein